MGVHVRGKYINCLWAGLVVMGAALAHETAIADDEGMDSTSYRNASVTLDLALQGYIRPHCSIKLDTRDVHEILTDEAGSTDFGFDVNCNQRLSVEIKSQNGGLLHENWQNILFSPGFADRIAYDLEFSVEAEGAEPVRVNSLDIVNMPGGGSIGVTPFESRGNVQINWSPEVPLIAGSYGDVIEIRVTGEGGMGGRS